MHITNMNSVFPGFYAFIGIGNKAKGIVHAHHNGKFDMDEAALESAVRCGLAESFPLQTLRYAGFALYVLCVVFSYASFIDYVVSFKRSFSAKKD